HHGRRLTALDADSLAVNSGMATSGSVRRAQSKGKKVYVWTVDDPVHEFQMMNLGVDGVITNRPGLAREVLARRATLSSLERIRWRLDSGRKARRVAAGISGPGGRRSSNPAARERRAIR
ncbi:MAG: hypothetical protein K8H90_03745, partial [Thermoanaerobaculia bacterium]|nr:hypothetical protein [Thermoanaerobaculia bacterium]